MDEETIGDVWTLFRSYLDKKQGAVAAEKFVDLLSDYGVDDSVLRLTLGVDAILDQAINDYLEDDEEE